MPPKKKPAVILPGDNLIKDVSKQVWRIGKRIGVGGFGEVFLCDKDSGRPLNERTAPCVIKIEPSGSGPLFVEMHFYMRNATKDSIDSWIKSKKLDYLGMPIMHSKGQYEVNNEVFRYIIIDRYAGDLESLIKKNQGKLPPKTALTTGVRVLDVLEYIHHCDYIHADVKASNIMLGYNDGNKVYICDFGLAVKYARDGVHKSEKVDKKKMHNGTIEYTSRDAHRGMESRRADVEILAYNLVHWLSGKLPWLDMIGDCKKVAASKEMNMENIKDFVQKCFGSKGNKTMNDFLKAVADLNFDEKPNYDEFRRILKDGLKRDGIKYDGKILEGKITRKRKSTDSEDLFSSEDDERREPVKRKTTKKTMTKSKGQKEAKDEGQSTSSQENLTPAMRQVLERRKQKDDAKLSKSTRSRNAQRV